MTPIVASEVSYKNGFTHGRKQLVLLLSSRLLVERRNGRQEAFDLADAILSRRMSREKFGWRSARRAQHLLPQRHARVRIIAGACSELEADAIGFRLVTAAEPRGDQVLISRSGEIRSPFETEQRGADAD